MSNATTHIKTEKQLVPALRFNGYGGEWSIKPLGSECNHITYGLTVRPDFVDNGIPLISAREVKTGEVNVASAPKISQDEFNKLSDKAKPKKGDVFLTKTGTIGFSARFMLDIPIAITQNIAVIRLSNDKINSADYLIQYFKTQDFYRSAISRVNQSTIMDLQLGDIKKILIPFPEFPEQQKIASFLSAVDEKTQQLTKKKALLEQYKKGVMQQLFSGQLRFKDENGNPYPDWEEKLLGEICSDVTYGLTVRPAFVDNGIPLLSAREISKGFINYESAPMISQEDFDNLSNKAKPVIGDLFLSKTGSIGFSALVKKNIIAAITQNIAIIRIRNKELHSANFILQYFKTRQFLKLAIAKVNQSTIMDLQLGDIKKLPLPDMAFEEQQKIATYLSDIDTKIEAVNNQITQTQTFKKGLLQQMFVAA